MEDFDWSTSITLDRRLLDAAFSLEFLSKHEHVLLGRSGGSGQEFSWPRPWATPPSGLDTLSASSMPTTTSGQWPKPESTTPLSGPAGPSCPLTC